MIGQEKAERRVDDQRQQKTLPQWRNVPAVIKECGGKRRNALDEIRIIGREFQCQQSTHRKAGYIDAIALRGQILQHPFQRLGPVSPACLFQLRKTGAVACKLRTRDSESLAGQFPDQRLHFRGGAGDAVNEQDTGFPARFVDSMAIWTHVMGRLRMRRNGGTGFPASQYLNRSRHA